MRYIESSHTYVSLLEPSELHVNEIRVKPENEQSSEPVVVETKGQDSPGFSIKKLSLMTEIFRILSRKLTP